jgi:F420H(2)-dependent quinone reductase
MTAVREPSTNLPPRIVVRTFWKLHRAAYRLTGGRFGLARPEEGAKFGMLRLATLGRRSGRSRVTMVGYYEDGPNLVTLAMNGWGATEPAWWLNLQEHADATVVLPDGPRSVRARAAVGEERSRLWSKFRDYPGWGDDLDGLAARRSIPTAVVVLEPSGGQRQAAGERATGDPSVAASPIAKAEATPEHRRRLRLRHLWIVPGLAIAVYASTQAERYGLGLAPLLLFTILPDVPRLFGIGQGHAHGQMAPRAVPLFNVMHHPVVPVAVAGLAIAGLLAPVWLVSGVAWLGHIVIGWGVGDGLRTADGYPRRRATAAGAPQAAASAESVGSPA